MRANQRGGGSPPLILVVDDNLDAREMYCMYLEHEGFECVDATNGTDAIAIAMKRRPALILMDATMPGMDGWQAAGYIKADPTLRDIPLIMLTAHAFEEHRRRAAAIGADHFLAKPVLPDELARSEMDSLELLRTVLEGAGATVITARSGPEALDTLSRESLDVLVADIGMPGMDGLELIRTVRQMDEPARSIPAAALTAYARARDRITSLASGFQMHLVKPIEPLELVVAVATLAPRRPGTN